MGRNQRAKERENKIGTPLYRAGDEYYLSHRSGLPAKIKIEMVYMKPRSREWMYAIKSEAGRGDQVFVPESVLSNRISKHSSKVYNMPEIIERVNEGYRFCGNYDDIESATSYGEKLALNVDIKSILLFPALDTNGNAIDGYGVWIKWKPPIEDASKYPIVIK